MHAIYFSKNKKIILEKKKWSPSLEVNAAIREIHHPGLLVNIHSIREVKRHAVGRRGHRRHRASLSPDLQQSQVRVRDVEIPRRLVELQS